MSNRPSRSRPQAPAAGTSGGRWGVALVLIAAAGAGTLLACGALCAGVGAFVSAARVDRERAAAKEATPLPPRGEERRPRQPQAVGFRKMTFTYRPKDDAARERQVLLWYPATGEDQPYNYHGQQGYATPDAPVAPGSHPLILFSHGFLGAADQTIFLMEAFARDGYIVAAVNHADAGNRDRKTPVARPDFADVKSWDETKFRDRRDDLVALLDHLLELDDRDDSFLHGHIDRQAVGAAGHSLGGYTVLGLVGGWPSWREPRVRAALLLSPYALPYLRGTNLRSVETPVMLQGGTLDWGITPFLPDVYKPLPGPKYYLVLKNETHFGWTNLISLGKTTKDCVQQGNGKLMTDYSLAFFNHHLRGEAAPLLRTKAPGLESYQFKADP